MKPIVLEDNLVITIRIVCILSTLALTIKINEYSLTFALITLVSFYYIRKKTNHEAEMKRIAENEKFKSEKSKNNNLEQYKIGYEISNPFKKMEKLEVSELPNDVMQKTKNDLLTHFLNDYSYAKSLEGFQTIKMNSECIFAKKSTVWGAPLWNVDIPIDDNINAFIPSFILFCNFCTHLKLDGYVVELPGWVYGDDLKVFAKIFCRILKKLSDSDPSNAKCMDTNFIDKKSWVFEFCKITFFITTFAPCYPENHPRYTFGAKNCYILFQPEISFALHDLPDDTPNTNWDNPKTVRDKIRIAFKNAGREYNIRETIYYPMSYDMIRPLGDNKNEIIEWWTYKNDKTI